MAKSQSYEITDSWLKSGLLREFARARTNPDKDRPLLKSFFDLTFSNNRAQPQISKSKI